MSDTIESFVAKLRQEGVQAGQEASEKLLAEARRQADEIVAQAHSQAKKIVEAADAQAAAARARSETDLQLAARDTALRLREALGRAIRGVLAAGAQEPLSNPDFLRQLLFDIIMQYVRADLGEKTTVKINVPPEMQQKLTAWAVGLLHEKHDMGNVSIDLRGTLAEAGFEYQTSGANVEVTLSSVVDVLSELVSPNLREVLERAMARPKP